MEFSRLEVIRLVSALIGADIENESKFNHAETQSLVQRFEAYLNERYQESLSSWVSSEYLKRE